MKKRPLGVKIFGVLFVLLGVYGVLQLGIYGPRLMWERGSMTASESGTMLVAALVAGTRSLVTLACGIGILMLKNWARILTLIGVWLLAVWQLAGAFFIARLIPAGWSSLAKLLAITTAWTGLITWYFLRPGVKAQFVKPRSGA